MSDYDRGKRRKKRSGYGGGSSRDRDRDNHDNDFGLSGTMVILAKPHHDQTHSQPTSSALSDPGSDIKLATALNKSNLKHDATGGSSAITPTTSRSTHNSGNADNSASKVGAPVYQLQQKQSSQTETNNVTLEQKLASPPDMLAPVKLIDEALQWCDNAMEFLQDQNDFYVIGVLGLQGSGKSTVLSLLSGKGMITRGRQIFKCQTEELTELGAHCTNGVDIYISDERVILLDTQPILSASVMDRIIQYEKKSLSGPEYTSTENALQMQSLQVAAFLMAVCHTIIVVQDWFVDPNLLRFIQAAEMLKPATPNNLHEMTSSVDDILEYYPHLVFVQNKCTQFDFAPDVIDDMDTMLSVIFAKSRLKYQGFVSLQESKKKNDLNKDKVNLFLLPDKQSDIESSSSFSPEYKGHPGFKELADSFSHQVLAMPLNMLTRTSLSEKNWFHYAARIWEAVKKSNLFLEYNRLLP